MTGESTLPPPSLDGSVSLEEALAGRESVRRYADKPLTPDEISQLLWAAQGKNPSGSRTAPSAGATYPLEVYALIGRAKGISPGIYKYLPEGHKLIGRTNVDPRAELFSAASCQESVLEASMSIVITGVYERTTARYGERGRMYVHMEAGHAAQNVCLQAVALGLGTVVIGAYDEKAVSSLLKLPGDEKPLYIVAIGKPAE